MFFCQMPKCVLNACLADVLLGIFCIFFYVAQCFPNTLLWCSLPVMNPHISCLVKFAVYYSSHWAPKATPGHRFSRERYF